MDLDMFHTSIKALEDVVIASAPVRSKWPSMENVLIDH
jgi:hypothetical protein